MQAPDRCRLAGALARELRAAREQLTGRWLERIAARVNLEPRRIFPSDQLLDHVPLLVDGIADYLEDPTEEITADVPVIAKAMELGELRYEQGFGADEILKEYEILGGVLFAFLVRQVDALEEPCPLGELLNCSHRLFRALSVIQQVTTSQYLRLAEERVREREERLRSFNRTVSHQLKNQIGAVMGAAEMLGEEWIREDPRQMERFLSIVASNAEGMQAVLQDLLSLSRMDGSASQQRHVLLPEAVAEVARQLREMAAEREVELRVDASLPEVEVNAPAVELCLANYLSNAIKYADPEVSPRWVEVRGEVREGERGEELVVEVCDNGIGVPEPLREQLFQRFFRADNAVQRGVEGTGLGLSIVGDTVESLGGRAWAEFPAGRGSAFKFALPLWTHPPAEPGEPGG